MKPMPSSTAILAVVLVCGVTAAGRAADPSTALNDLDSDDYKVREAATHRLLADNTLSVRDVRHLYARAATDEQRQRLLVVARHHFLRQVARDKAVKAEKVPNLEDAKAGALGVHTDAVTAEELPELKVPAIRVTQRLAGFPAFAALKRDDLIIAVNGVNLSVNNLNGPFAGRLIGPDTIGNRARNIANRFSDLVKRHPAGTEIHFTVVRDRKTIRVDVTLANLNALDEMYQQVFDDIFAPQHGLRRQDIRFGLKPPVKAAWERERRLLLASNPAKARPNSSIAIEWYRRSN
jgi:hypothetical protein